MVIATPLCDRLEDEQGAAKLRAGDDQVGDAGTRADRNATVLASPQPARGIARRCEGAVRTSQVAWDFAEADTTGSCQLRK